MECNLDPNRKAPTWKGGTVLRRFDDCRMMLLLNGFLSEAESRKVRQRMKKWAAKHGVSLKSPADGDVIGPGDIPIQ